MILNKSAECVSRYGLALVAGAIGLIVEVVSARLFAQEFGATAQTAGGVLALFLSGFAVGAWLLGHWADQAHDPLQLAGLLVACCGLSIAVEANVLMPPSVISDVVSTGVPTAFALQREVRLLIAMLLLLLITMTLGGVLPALIQSNLKSNDQFRRRISALYGLETLGGAIGGSFAGFWLIEGMGLKGTLWLASGASVTAGGLVAIAARWRTSTGAVEARRQPLNAAQSSRWHDDYLLLAATGLAGCAALGGEVVWTRLLVLVLGSDTYAFTIVITTFLLGLFGGALIAYRLSPRLMEPISTFVWLQIAAAGTSLVLLLVFQRLATGAGQQWLASLGGGTAMIGGRFSLCFFLLLFPTTLIGLSFPVAAGHFVQQLRGVGQRTGLLSAFSALGNVAGALVTGFLLIPSVGLQSSLVALAAISLIAAACAWFTNFSLYRHRGKRMLAATTRQAVVIALGWPICASWNWLGMIEPLALDGRSKEYDVAYYREGSHGTVAVLQRHDEPDVRFMSIDGVVIGESRGTLDEKQRMLAHLPLLANSNRTSQRILTIGLGTGILAGELTRQAQVAEVVCVELSPEVIEGARHFADVNEGIHQHPRAQIVAGDGIYYLRKNPAAFDAIVSDAKSRPGHVSNVAFYSTDFYMLCQQRLRRGGVFVQWVSLETPPRELRTVLSTFTRSFRRTYIGVSPPTSLYLIGTDCPLELDLVRVQEHLKSPASRPLWQYGWRDACDIAALFLADEGTVADWLGEDESINTLERPVLEFMVANTFDTPPRTHIRDNLAALVQLSNQEFDSMHFDTGGAASPWNCQQSARMMLRACAFLFAGESGSFDQADVQFHAGLEFAPQHARLRYLAASAHLERATAAEEVSNFLVAIDHCRRAQFFGVEDVAIHQRLGALLRRAGAFAEAAQVYYSGLEIEPHNVKLRLAFAHILAQMEKSSQALAQYRRIINEHPDEPQAHLGLGLILLAQNDAAQGRLHLKRAVELAPKLWHDIYRALKIDVFSEGENPVAEAN